MPSLDSALLTALRFSAQDAATLRQLGEYRGKQELFARQRPEVLETLRTVAVVESSESSNRLEGIEAPKERIEQLVLADARPRNRSEQEIAGYRDALHLIHDAAPEMAFSTNVILQLHGMLYRYLPQPGGRWKSTDNQIVERSAEGVERVRFEAVPAVRTEQAMATLVHDYRSAIDARSQDPLIVVPLAIFDFLCVHPFTDGNGRMARLLTLQLLYHFDYQVGRYVSLERVFEESRETYYESLEASSAGWHDSRHDPFPWLRYFWGALLRAYGDFEERVGRVTNARGAKTEQVRAAVGRRVTPFRISELQRDCPGVSKEMIRVVLRRMKDEGTLVVEGHGRGARWRRLEE